MDFWILVAYSHAFDDLVSYSHLKKCLKQKLWGFESKHEFQYNLKKGDKVVFYLGGVNKQYFFGSAVVASEQFVKLRKNPEEKFYNILLDGMDRAVCLEDIDFWKTPKSIRDIIHKISFIKTPAAFGMYLTQPFKKISKGDYETITKKRLRGTNFVET